MVPEDRAKPAGRMLPLKVVVVPAKSPQPGSTPIFYFQGGPGQAATDNAAFFIDAPERQNHDMVVIDQRGTGEGHRLACPGPGTDEELGSWFESPYQAPYPRLCRELLEKSADLRFYTTAIAAQDVDEIRRALGYDKINLAGGSYGSRAALIYIKMFGEHVRSAMLSGLAPLEARLPLHHPIGAQRALDRVFADCASDARCNAAFPNLPAMFEALRAQLRTRPVVVEVKHPQTGAAVSVKLTETRLLGAIRPMLYSTQMQRHIPLAIHLALKGDFSRFAPAAFWARGANQAIAAGMSLSVICSEDVARIVPGEIERLNAGTFLGPQFVHERVEACREWPKGELPPDHFEPFTSNVPVLLVTGEYDPVTPLQLARMFERHFPNSVHVIAPTGHLLPEDCLGKVAASFFATGDPRSADLACIRATEVPPFALP